MMVKVFRLSNYELASLVIESPRAAVHWRADIYSKVTEGEGNPSCQDENLSLGVPR
jgi:hypothetical protein